MKGLVLEGPFKLGLKDVPVPVPADDEVLIRIAFCGICGTDLHCEEGLRKPPWVSYPVILGHEWSGVIEKCGKSVKYYKPGDRVVAEGIMYCGVCRACMRGQTGLCQNFTELGTIVDGGFAEYLKVSECYLHKIPDNVPLEEAAFMEPMGCSHRAVVRSEIQPGDTVVVCGHGPIGLLCVLIARLYGPAKIILFGRSPDRLAAGKKLGAIAVKVDEEDPKEKVLSLTHGEGADVVIECAGSLAAQLGVFEWVRPGGRIVFEGVIGDGSKPAISLDDFVVRELNVLGAGGYTKKGFDICLRLLSEGLVDVKPLISHKLPLKEWRKAFDLAKNRKAVKVLLYP
jgi:threonine dehydrogenase-like Zn-dependent dehydrogenase